MCDAKMAMGLMGFGVGMDAMSASREAEAQKNSLEYNAKVSEMQARDAEARGQSKVDLIRTRGRQLKGSQKARMAASGVQLDSGTPLQILTQTDEMVDIDVQTAFDNTDKEASSYRSQAAFSSNRAKSTSPVSAGVTSLLGGATQAGASIYKMKSNGLL
ncbi:MAG: hypothetical protein DSZ27_08380 [Thiomicrospira sp.]|nr:MAG: hypothetical protein DSZ27_08380 [Thiomicrospira sp.]